MKGFTVEKKKIVADVEISLWKEFKAKCSSQGKSMKEVLIFLMQNFLNEKITLDKVKKF